jgi:DNA modification methylase
MTKRTIAIGDIYRIGQHQLACGDSRDAAFVSQVFDGNHAALILTDIPYAVAYVENKFSKSKTLHAPILNDHLQSDAEFATFTQSWLEAARPHLTPKNAAYVFCSDKMLLAFRDGMVASGFRFGQMLHWLKTASVLGRLDYAPQSETILYFWHGAHEFFKSKDKNVIIHPKPTKNKFHPTCKPIPVLRHLILNSSRIGDLVYEPFAGSGTTALACEMTKRRSVSIELEPKYCQVIIDRLGKLTGQKAVLLSQAHHGR